MEKLIAILFLTREVSHRLHLKTKTYAHHMALNTLYDDIIDIADELAEGYQGKYGVMQDIPYLTWERDMDDTKTIEYLLAMYEKARKNCCMDDSYLQNIMDSATQLYRSTLYKLTNLR